MRSKKARIVLTVGVLLAGLTSILFLDITQARRTATTQGKFLPESAFDAVSGASTTVAIVRSDNEELPDPAPVDGDLTYEQIENMVREAIELAGGLDWLVHAGDMVLLKPDIVDPEPPGVGEITDVKVVKAVARIVNEVAPGEVEIVVGEGSPRPMDYELPYSGWDSPAWEELWDKSGFQTLLGDPDLEGVNLRLSNLNGSPPEDPWQDLILVEVPGGGYADAQKGKYWIHKDVLNADVFITIPVMKVHNMGLTAALKNQIGILPSTRYGFSKSSGVPQDGKATRLIHYADEPRDWVEEEIVDACTLADIDFVVVDALMCLELSKSAQRSGSKITNQVQMNTILAGPDPVATDHVCARLMGMNPDDIAHITLAAKRGLGTNDPGDITVVGNTIEETAKRFKKDPRFTSIFGQGNRTWLLTGPFDTQGIDKPMEHEFLADEAHLRPEADADGWSEPIYFFDDRIDLEAFYADPEGRTVSYAFTYFDAPRTQEATFWTGSDEALRIYLNGEVVYDYAGSRAFNKDELVKDKVRMNILEGENTLLVKVFQSYSRYDFSLNICEPEPDPDYTGNRVLGLTFRTESAGPAAVNCPDVPGTPHAFAMDQNHPNPFNAGTTVSFTLPGDGPSDRMDVRMDIYNITGQRIRTLMDGTMSAGTYRMLWNGKDEFGADVATGTYLARLNVNGGSWTDTIKMSVIR